MTQNHDFEIAEATQFHLWARLYVTGVDSSLDEPPNIPKRMSVEKAIASTAQYFAQAISGKTSNIQLTLIHTSNKSPTLHEQVNRNYQLL